MAIVAMKKVTLVAMKEDSAKLLKSMQKLGCIEISAYDEEELSAFAADPSALEDSEKRLSQIENAIKILSSHYKTKSSLLSQRPVLDSSVIDQKELDIVITRLEEIERSLLEISGHKARIATQIEQWLPWRSLSIPVEHVQDTTHCQIQLGTVDKFKVDFFVEKATEMGAVVDVLFHGRSGVNVFYANHKDAIEDLAPILKEAGFTRVQFTGLKGTFNENIHALESELKKLEQKSLALNEEKIALAKNVPALQAAYDLELIERDRLRASQRLLCTQSAFMMTGWVPEVKADTLTKEVKRISSDAVLEITDPQEDDKPPVLLENRWFGSQFEGVVQMYSLPSYTGLDPTSVMGPFFVMFFGMMVSDAGYGIILSVFAALYLLTMKPKDMIRQITGILIMGGAATFFWGLMFGGIFGIEIKPLLFAPMSEPLLMLGLCFGLGFIHLIGGLCVGIYMNLQRKKPLDAFFDQGLWIIALFGLPMLAVPQLASVGKVLSIVGLGGVALTAGRHAKGGPIKKLLSGLGSLYDLSGYLSDVLSYARLFGMGLATGIIGMVINIVAGMVMTNPIGIVLGVIVLIGGHAFNLFINALGAFVHSSRLQYIEFFSKFYESGGNVFRPLRITTKYMDVKEDSLQ